MTVLNNVLMENMQTSKLNNVNLVIKAVQNVHKDIMTSVSPVIKDSILHMELRKYVYFIIKKKSF